MIDDWRLMIDDFFRDQQSKIANQKQKITSGGAQIGRIIQFFHQA
jgi:hypothetical protein